MRRIAISTEEYLQVLENNQTFIHVPLEMYPLVTGETVYLTPADYQGKFKVVISYILTLAEKDIVIAAITPLELPTIDSVLALRQNYRTDNAMLKIDKPHQENGVSID